jgi:hypothetical protein
MVNGVISINIRLNEDLNESKSHTNENKTTGNEILHTPLIRAENCTENSHLSMLTIADREEMLDIINCINSSSTLSPLSHKPSDISRKANITESPSKIDLIKLKSGFSVANSAGSSFNSPNLHPDLQELVLSLDPTVSLDELSMQLEQPLSEVIDLIVK